MNTTRRGFLASVAALLGVKAAAKSEQSPKPTTPSLPTVGDSDQRSEVTFVGGPMDGLRRPVWVRAREFIAPVAPAHVGLISDGRVTHSTFRSVTYERCLHNPKQFVFRGIR